MDQQSPFKWRHFEADIILLCVHWHLRYALSTVDKNAPYPKAFNELKEEGTLPQACELRQVKYLNNIVKQDHRFIKRLVKPGPGLLFL
jgi:transposase-like protein